MSPHLMGALLSGSVALVGQALSDSMGPAPQLPLVMHFCAQNCMTLKREGPNFVVVDNGPNAKSLWVVEKFTRESVLLHRHDTPSGLDLKYSGQINEAGNALINVTMNGTAAPFIQLTWGSALEATPGNNLERARRLATARPSYAPPAPPPTQRDQDLAALRLSISLSERPTEVGISQVPLPRLNARNQIGAGNGPWPQHPLRVRQCETPDRSTCPALNGCEMFMESVSKDIKRVTNCAAWTLNGDQLQGYADSGDFSTLTVQSWTKDRIEIHRAPAQAATGGNITADYQGRMDAEGRISGEVTWHWPNGGMRGTWSAVVDGTTHDLGAPPQPGLDLTGLWSSPAQTADSSNTVTFEQKGKQLRMQSSSGALLAEATFTSPYIAHGRFKMPSNDASADTWEDEDFVIDNPDRIHMWHRQFTFRRAAPRSTDLPCDTSNSWHIDAEFALARGREALGAGKGQSIWENTTVIDRRGAQPATANNFSLAACWITIAAQEGNGAAQAALASLYREGHGVGRDPAAAFLWAARSAGQHDASGELLLAELYRSGTGTGADAEKADYWLAWSGLPLRPRRKSIPKSVESRRATRT